MLAPFQDWFNAHKEKIYADFFKYLRFQSVSSEEAHKGDMAACASFLVDYLSDMGLEVNLHETSNHPFVFATKMVDPSLPTLLLYHHYDVQPVDPIELWDSPPFEPEEREGKIFGRGTGDNKGQAFYTFMALKAFLELKGISAFNLKIVIEGGEEIGSPGLTDSLPTNKELFNADYLLIIDSCMESLAKPSVALGLRGIVTMDFEIQSAQIDAHSGLGGVIPNSAKVMTRVLSKLFDDEGRVLLDGFYDDVEPISEDEKREIFARDFDREELKETYGIDTFAPEPGFTLKESSSIRPTLEINGIGGGYQGDGFKTVIPAKTAAKLSMRTVAHQDVDKLLASLRTFFEKHVPEGISWTLTPHGIGQYYKSRLSSPIVQVVREAYGDVFGKPCEAALLGGSVPITADLCAASGAEALAIGTVTFDNQFHAPNEFIYTESFEKGFLTITRIFDILDSEKP